MEPAVERPGVDSSVGDRAVEDRADESGRHVLDVLEEEEVASRQLSVVVVRGGPDVHAEQIGEPPDLRPERVGPGEARRLPLTPGRIPCGPPADDGGALVEGRRRERGGDGASRWRRGGGGRWGRLRLFRALPDRPGGRPGGPVFGPPGGEGAPRGGGL